MVTIVKCPCRHAWCPYYGLSDGFFSQGTGWPKERAQQYADAINAYDAMPQAIKDMRRRAKEEDASE